MKGLNNDKTMKTKQLNMFSSACEFFNVLRKLYKIMVLKYTLLISFVRHVFSFKMRRNWQNYMPIYWAMYMAKVILFAWLDAKLAEWKVFFSSNLIAI